VAVVAVDPCGGVYKVSGSAPICHATVFSILHQITPHHTTPHLYRAAPHRTGSVTGFPVSRSSRPGVVSYDSKALMTAPMAETSSAKP
jgi:hypothetical protein